MDKKMKRAHQAMKEGMGLGLTSMVGMGVMGAMPGGPETAGVRSMTNAGMQMGAIGGLVRSSQGLTGMLTPPSSKRRKK